ncbi:MAG: TMEM175 family protein [Propionicimonas sp.]|uniref:TMEM175 family protein n=1 Tax=Propionicimonas sp. TaxID=1955623 RepID=UPI002B1F90A8|nr:TMEM175 family protein [Propionicimonas sp.]MEA4945679.1 TMEM175 family protein [Propionicimonas sp.]MEA5055174.1 TMEM175 family protein [Propionicimonas sp.]MEA5118681.1 TMEM175 family protein [Propionicimonas sp.]
MVASRDGIHPVERLVFFTDAVVAIAMTLLILPLVEAVTEAARAGLDTAQFLVENEGPLLGFGLSFVIIAAFWRSHDRLFEHVGGQDAVLLWLNVGWMFTIVWLPVATALVGALDTDRVQLGVYIGSMLATSLLTLAMHLWVRRRLALQQPDRPMTIRSTRALAANSSLFAVALLLAVGFPELGFWALLVLLADPLLARLLNRHAPS